MNLRKILKVPNISADEAVISFAEYKIITMDDTYSAGLSDINTGGTDGPTSSDLQNLHSSGGKYLIIVLR